MAERRARDVEREKRGLYAEFGSDSAAVEAARRLNAAGHVVLDAFAPRPVAALEAVVAPGRSNLNRTVFVWACFGAFTGLGIEWACNAWDFPLNVGGRPPFALPAYIPITFEATVLFASFAAFFGFMHRAGLPRLSHAAFEVPGFERASIDRFFLLVAPVATGSEGELRALLLELGALNVVAPSAANPLAEPVTPAADAAPHGEPAE
jgi:hypothetical protein